MVGDRQAEAVVKHPRRTLARVLGVLALCGATLLPACSSPRTARPARETRPLVAATEFGVKSEYWEFDPVEIAVLRPGGDAPSRCLAGLRDGLYAALIEKGYSPLDPAYVDARPVDLSTRESPFELRAAVTGMTRTSDGGLLISGWAGLLAPEGRGGDSLYLLELIDYVIPPGRGTRENEGAAEAGRKLGTALLAKLPAR